MKHSLLLLFFLFFNGILATAQPKILRVKRDAAGQNNGTSWEDAFPLLNTAIQSAVYGDTIWVAAGTYKPTNDSNRDSSFTIKNGVCLFGGFLGTETALFQRNFDAYPTILSGDIGVPGDSTDNSYNIMVGTNADTTTIIDGFIMERGMASSVLTIEPKPNRKRGGAIYLRPVLAGNSAAPLIRNCVFRNNFSSHSGQAIHAEEIFSSTAFVRIENCKVLNNYNGSGAIHAIVRKHDFTVTDCYFGNNGLVSLNIAFLSDSARLLIERDTFSSPAGTKAINIIEYGSATSNLEVSNCVFYNNSNGKIIIDSQNSSPLCVVNLHHCSIFDNQSFSIECGSRFFNMYENAVYNNSGFFVRKLPPYTIFTIFDNDFLNNESLGIAGNGVFNINNNRFTGDQVYLVLRGAYQDGIGTTYGSSKSTIANCLFYQNKLTSTHSYFSTASASILFQNCSFIARNNPPDDKSFSFAASGADSLIFNSCLFSGNQGQYPIITPDSVWSTYFGISHCVFEDDCQQVLPNAGQEICSDTTNMFGVHPQFYSVNQLDFRLLPCSPGINAGDLSAVVNDNILTDMAGNPRVSNGLPDAGALETDVSLVRQNSSDVSCHGKKDGKIVYSDGGCYPYFYHWQNDQGAAGSTLTGLSPGTYTVTVTDSNGITLLDTVTIHEPPIPWTLSFVVLPASPADGNLGGIYTYIPDGNEPIQYLWSNGGTLSYLTDLIAGTYSLTVTDANGCTADYSFEVGTVGTTDMVGQPMQLMPNPVKAGANIRITPTNDGTLQLISPSGSALFLVPVRSGLADLPSTLTPGIYGVIFTDTAGKKTWGQLCVIRE